MHARERRRFNLRVQIANRECNYWRLMKLMPGWQGCNLFAYDHCPHRESRIRLKIEIYRRSPHTLVIDLRQQSDENTLPVSWLQNMRVHLYLDLRSAEAVACNDRPLKLCDPCPEEWQRQLDEKISSDYFLADLLTFWIDKALTPVARLPKLAFNGDRPEVQPLAGLP